MQICNQFCGAVKEAAQEIYNEPGNICDVGKILFTGAFVGGALLSSGSWSRCLVNAAGITVLSTLFTKTFLILKDDNVLGDMSKSPEAIFLYSALTTTLAMLLSSMLMRYSVYDALPKIIAQVAAAHLASYAVYRLSVASSI